MPRSRSITGFDLESILADLEADLREVIEELTEHTGRRDSESRPAAPSMPAQDGPHPKPVFRKVKSVVFTKDFELSKRFYGEIFETSWESDQFCEFRVGGSEFLLQDGAEVETRPICVHQVTAVDAQSAWQFLSKVVAKYAGTSVLPPKLEPWGTVVYLNGPSGESWCVTEPRHGVDGI